MVRQKPPPVPDLDPDARPLDFTVLLILVIRYKSPKSTAEYEDTDIVCTVNVPHHTGDQTIDQLREDTPLSELLTVKRGMEIRERLRQTLRMVEEL